MEEKEEEEYGAGDWSLHIHRIDNGFLLQGNGLDALREEAIVEMDLKACDHNEDVQEAMLAMELLDAVQEYFALGGSKYSQRRCHTMLIPGTKFEGEDDFDDKEYNWLYHWITEKETLD